MPSAEGRPLPFCAPQTGNVPNILWLTWEDIGPHLHCCGDEYSIIPNFDYLAKRGCVYDNAWASAPVCAPARTAIIPGVCPTSTGAEHMRSMSPMPAGWKMFPGYLHDAGYYCTNKDKEDYHLEKPEGTWDVSSEAIGGCGPAGDPADNPVDPARGPWRNRKPGKPFLAVFNDMTTHESQIFRSATNQNLLHDLAKAWLASFQPDTMEMRRDWAQYHDILEDARNQARLDELEQDGLTQDTIIVVTSDHGCGAARYKRMPHDSGLHVPMILCTRRSTGTWRRRITSRRQERSPRRDHRSRSHDAERGRDQAAQLLSGQGLRGTFRSAAPPYLNGMQGRMDERYDLMRSTRDKRFVYIRNYNPHRIYAQHVTYAWNLPSTPVWERLYNRIVSEKLGSEAANPIFQFVADLHQTVRKRAVRGGFQS